MAKEHWLTPWTYNGVCDVQYNFRTYYNMLLNKVASLFVWKNLPECIDQRFLEFNLLLIGKVCWTEIDGKLYVLDGNIGGEPNVYYEPTYWIVANPVLGSKQVRIRNRDGSNDIESLDGILMANSDTDYESLGLCTGVANLIYQTAGLLADNISSLNVAQINGRLSTLFTAESEALARTGEEILHDIYNGKPYKILTEDLVEKFGITPVASNGTNNTLMSLIEAHQYILAQFYQEIGIQANYNMKRERLNTAEVEMNNGALDVNIWNMLKNRQEAVALINQKYGTDISVDLNFAVFNEDSGNAEGPVEEEVIEEEEVNDITQQDEEFQVDGVVEDSENEDSETNEDSTDEDSDTSESNEKAEEERDE